MADPGRNDETVPAIAARRGFVRRGGFTRLYQQVYGPSPQHDLPRHG